MIVAATRLHLRSRRFVLPFLAATWRIANQVCRAEGFRVGRLLRAPGGIYWTLTAWDDAAATNTFRDSGPHLRIMPQLSRWCFNAAFTCWEAPDGAMPSWSEVGQRLTAESVRWTPSRPPHVEVPPEGDDPRRGYLSLPLVPGWSMLGGLLQSRRARERG